MAGRERTNSWKWRESSAAAARNGRTALLAVLALALTVALTGPEETFVIYGRMVTGSEQSADAGRLVFLGMAVLQSTLAGWLTAMASLLSRLTLHVLRTVRARASASNATSLAGVADA